MAKWLQSGRRRDMCVILASERSLTGQQLKTRLSTLYDERIDPDSFYGALSTLEDAGWVDRESEGIADVYTLTEVGERRVREHYEWMREALA